MNLKKRIEALESRLLPGFITLRLRDGSARRIPDCLLDVFCGMMAAGRDETWPLTPQAIQKVPHLKEILETVEDDSRGSMVQLIQALANSPTGTKV